MNNLMKFLKLAALGGLLVLLPVLLFILLLMEIVQLVVGLATPIAGIFPAGTFDDPKHPVALAFIMLFGASLLIGLAMKSSSAQRLGNWVEEKTLNKLPIYRFVKTLVSGLVGAEKTGSFKPALFDAGNGQREISIWSKTLAMEYLQPCFRMPLPVLPGLPRSLPRNGSNF